jgi:hypothetical protein
MSPQHTRHAPQQDQGQSPQALYRGSISVIEGQWFLEEEGPPDRRADGQGATMGDPGQLLPCPRDVGRVSRATDNLLVRC